MEITISISFILCMLKASKYLNLSHLFNIFIIIVAVTSIHGNLAYGVAGVTNLVCILISDTATHLFSVEVNLFMLLPVWGGSKMEGSHI
jgi:hypothetical protein